VGVPLLILCKKTFGVNMTRKKAIMERNKTLSRLEGLKIYI
jgi:hypothetical protein